MRQVNEALRQARMAGGEEVTDAEEEEEDDDDQEWSGIEDDTPAVVEFVDHEEEYIDEDKYTTVTVEAVDIDRDGMHALSGRHTSDSEASEACSDDDGKQGEDGLGQKKDLKGGATEAKVGSKDGQKKVWPKKKRKKFRYESKNERALSKGGRKKR